MLPTGLGLLAAVGLTGVGATPVFSAPSEPSSTVQVSDEGAVPDSPSASGPQITNVRILDEGKFLEIDWNEYVDEEAAVNPANIKLTNGSREVKLVPKPKSGPTDTIFFDRKNKQIGATDADSMHILADDVHKASIAYSGDLDPDRPTTVTVKGSRITDSNGKPGHDATYTEVPRTSFYSRHLEAASGITIKATPDVEPRSLTAAAGEVDHQLSKPGTGIAAQMASRGCSLAVFGSRENAYLIPEHRKDYDPEMYDVEGYGGTVDQCVSSISERNVNRIKNSSDPLKNSLYPDENILAHEFGHAVRLVGIDTQKDSALSKDFYAVYKHAHDSGLWPNTYAISNSDEFFAVMTAVWFNTMSEAPDWSDGVRSPLNTRAEMKKYDPQTYAFFSRIYPEQNMPSPWDEPAPDSHHKELVKAPTAPKRESATGAKQSDGFRLETFDTGVEYQADVYTCDPTSPENKLCMSDAWGDGTWRLDYDHGSYTITDRKSGDVLTAVGEDQVSMAPGDDARSSTTQEWRFRPEGRAQDDRFAGTFVNVENGRALGIERSFPGRDQAIVLTSPSDATNWMLKDTTRSDATGTNAYLRPIEVNYEVGDEHVHSESAAAQFFTLPKLSEVIDTVPDGKHFVGWKLAGSSKILPRSWTVPEESCELSLIAVYQATPPPSSPATHAPGTDPSSPTSAPPATGGSTLPTSATDAAADPTDTTASHSSSATGAENKTGLVSTGSDTLPWIGLGTAAIAAGLIAIVWSARRRRH